MSTTTPNLGLTLDTVNDPVGASIASIAGNFTLLDTAFVIPVPAFATPSIALGTAATAGAAGTVIRSDATIVAFDATAPTTSAVGDAAAVGAATVTARRDHRHGREAFATPTGVDLSDAGAAAAGAATTLMRSDSVKTVLTATPGSSAPGDVAARGSATSLARSDHVHGRETAFKIAENIAGGAVASVTFSSIPGTYRNVYLKLQVRGDTAATSTGLYVQFNADTAANYDFIVVTVQGTPTLGQSSGIADVRIQIGDAAAANAPSNVFTSGRVDVPNYAGTTAHKATLAQAGLKQSAAAASIYVETGSGWWRSTAAITSIKVFPGAGNFIAGSSFFLYGEP